MSQVVLPPISGAPWSDLDDGLQSDEELMNAYIDERYGPTKMSDSRFPENEIDLCNQLSKRDNHFTEDYLERKLDSSIAVLVYGTLKAGGTNASLLEDASYIGRGETGDPRFYMMETLSFPIACEVPPKDKLLKKRRGRIKGEVYMIDALQLMSLDQLESNGRMYTRQKVWVRMLDQVQSGVVPTLPCWMYLGNLEYFDPRYLGHVKPHHDGTYMTYDWDQMDDLFERRWNQ